MRLVNILEDIGCNISGSDITFEAALSKTDVFAWFNEKDNLDLM